MNKQKLYNPVIDILRTISIFAVILIHTTTRTMEIAKFKITEIPLTVFLNQITRFAVPLFFMISGFVLELNAKPNETYLTYLRKRISRIFIPYVFWSLIYYLFIYYKGRDPNFFNSILTGDASYQLYFIPTLVIFYLLFPLLHKLFKYIGNIWIILILFLIQLLFLFNDYYNKSINIPYPLAIALLNYFVFIFGMYLAKNKDLILNIFKKLRFILFSVFIFSGIFVFFEGFYGYLTTKNYLTIYSQWRPSILVYTISMSGFLYYLLGSIRKYTGVIKAFSSLSFFVFFIHVAVLENIWSLIFKKLITLDNEVYRQVWFDPIFFLLVLSISYFIAFIVHRIPILSKITG